ncbi:thioredoxin-dependent thiol peroxidase [uncultured Litoreibacter sp.]|uniref:thioredoxin-dependent thiol peroxidase n=1 Tax=uncultured Litoreibacter sp. TaxID=1392394 RepID=UPI0026364E56|nr:thioredoxin-dependent thiol peroxidase [uncultured Litoreibacter sp.]
MTQVGEMAPDFTLPRDGGDNITLSKLRPSMVVVYFYPKDNTPGCTKQAIGFTEHMQAFRDAGCEIIGISKDSVKKHDNFRAKHALEVILASDADSDVCEQYGVWKEKSMYGKTFMGIERSTFLIGGDGVVVQEWRKVRVADHVEAVLDAVKSQ